MPIGELAARLERSGRVIVEKATSHGEEQLDRVVGEATLAEVLLSFGFHESYHAGQIAVVRRLIGKEGVLR